MFVDQIYSLILSFNLVLEKFEPIIQEIKDINKDLSIDLNWEFDENNVPFNKYALKQKIEDNKEIFFISKSKKKSFN